jgi:hypothetical protein
MEEAARLLMAAEERDPLTCPTLPFPDVGSLMGGSHVLCGPHVSASNVRFCYFRGSASGCRTTEDLGSQHIDHGGEGGRAHAAAASHTND